MPQTWKLHRNLLVPEPDVDDDVDEREAAAAGTIPFSAQGFRKNQVYKITSPTGVVLDPPRGRCWGATEREFKKLLSAGRIYWPRGGNGRPRVVPDPGGTKGLVPNTLWMAKEVGDTEDSKKLLMEIFADRADLGIHAPKPHQLVERILEISTSKDSTVLDSFAGSGTTAHAVLEVNRRDGGDRRFVLVECEDYADSLTAERVRRVVNGYAFVGTHKEVLYEKKLTLGVLRKADEVLAELEGIASSAAERFEEVDKSVDEGVLVVAGVNRIKDQRGGLGGAFTYCTLGEPVDVDEFLTGKGLPSRDSLSEWLVYTAFGMSASKGKAPKTLGALKDRYVATIDGTHVWLLYEPNVKYLQESAALTLELARQIADTDRHSKHLVFSPVKYVSQKTLRAEKIPVEHALLPFSLAKLERT